MDQISVSEKWLILWTLTEIFTTENLGGFRQDLTGERSRRISNYFISLGAKGKRDKCEKK